MSDRILIWDLPVRLLHAVLALSLTAALGLGFALDDHHPWFAYHALAGLVAAGALGLRLLLGLFGPRQVRFAGWPLAPARVVEFLSQLGRAGEGRRYVGHNPLAAWVMAGLLAVSAAAVATGMLGGEDLHEVLAGALVALIGLHLAGLAWHTVRHREAIALAMFDGRKVAPPEAAVAVRGWLAVVLLGGLAAWGAMLGRGFDPANGVLTLPGVPAIQLLEGEHGSDKNHRGSKHSHHDDDDE